MKAGTVAIERAARYVYYFHLIFPFYSVKKCIKGMLGKRWEVFFLSKYISKIFDY